MRLTGRLKSRSYDREGGLRSTMIDVTMIDVIAMRVFGVGNDAAPPLFSRTFLTLSHSYMCTR